MSHPILVTGAAGFVGMHVAQHLLANGATVVGVDNLNSYYDPLLKQARLYELARHDAFTFQKIELSDSSEVERLFAAYKFPYVVHLAAQAGVRHSLIDPYTYAESNLKGFLNILEGCRHSACRHLIYASSSSVYGANTKVPFSTADSVDHPLSLYGATKKANELMAHAYAHLFAIPATGLRFFTVYGPWGRPDMAMWLFAQAILAGKPIPLFNYGDMYRDFTYIDDVAKALVKLLLHPAAPDPAWSSSAPDPSRSSAPWRVYNIGNSNPVSVSHVVKMLERELGCTAQRELLPMQPGDVYKTCADVTDLAIAIGFRPSTTIEEGIRRFVAWYREYHGLSPKSAADV